MGLTILLTGCSAESMEKLLSPMVVAPPATIERDVKGHDQIYAIQVVLRMARQRPDNQTYSAYGLSNFVTPPLPLFQQIDLSKDDAGNVTITSKRKAFDVVKGKNVCYGLELKYYDLNGKLINHQFSHYDPEDLESSTLLHHQHFFTLQNYSLYGQQLTYPMRLDSTYYDRYLFKTDDDDRCVRSTVASPVNVYVPVGKAVKDNLRYNAFLGQKAVEVSMTRQATDTYRDPSTGTEYELYKAMDQTTLNGMVKEIFTYDYRDTDPVEDELRRGIKGSDDMGRLRVGDPVKLLQRNRDLMTATNYDRLGFKGILRFHKSDMAFQMRICISHMITATEKYFTANGVQGLNNHDEIQPSWNTFDIDYPIAFRVIADADEPNKEKFLDDVRRFYPEATADGLARMFAADDDYYRHIPQITM